MVNGICDELSFQARSTSEWAYYRNTLFALRSLCCIDLPAAQEECREASGEWPTGPVRGASLGYRRCLHALREELQGEQSDRRHAGLMGMVLFIAITSWCIGSEPRSNSLQLMTANVIARTTENASPGFFLYPEKLRLRVLRRGERHLRGSRWWRGQVYTEDCAVCCRPNLITVTPDADGDAQLEVTQEYEA